MPSIRWIDYEATRQGIAEVARKLCFDDTDLSIDFRDIPERTVDFQFGPERHLTMIRAETFSSEERDNFYSFGGLAALPLMHYVRRRYPRLNGVVRVDVDDFGVHGDCCYCSNSEAFTLIPDHQYLASVGYQWTRDHWVASSAPWTERDDRVVWRGSSTGIRSQGSNWRSLQRVRLCEIAQALDQSVFDVGMTAMVQTSDPDELAEMERSGLRRDRIEKWTNYRYLIDIDGNSNAWSGLFTKLLMGAAVLKVASPYGYRQWYYDRLTPWVNFVPVRADMSDLEHVVRWLRANPARSAAIGKAGQDLALSLSYDSVLDDIAPQIRTAAETPAPWK